MKINLPAVMTALVASGYFNTNAGSTLYVCATDQPDDLDASEYAALTWVQVTGVGSHGEAGTSTNILTYDTWDTEVAQKAKGISDAGSPDIEVARDPDDAGQVILRTAANTNLNYAFKIERNDNPDPSPGDGTPTIIYNRGLVTGPRRPFGRNEDFDLEIFSLALQQKEIVVAPTVGTP